ncbi:hypothetical protein GCM10011452_38400 [Gemmobacter lanyuensis]|uniref:Uncharacterized protein n=1 Tax=Gemmobacter lanyuensis TaxID=1054497 RepID=A0A918MQU3_9RHOB|nr:hypothetical protein GCM10011452_38400 [Gemmobacter lanyuensis]
MQILSLLAGVTRMLGNEMNNVAPLMALVMPTRRKVTEERAGRRDPEVPEVSHRKLKHFVFRRGLR